MSYMGIDKGDGILVNNRILDNFHDASIQVPMWDQKRARQDNTVNWSGMEVP